MTIEEKSEKWKQPINPFLNYREPHNHEIQARNEIQLQIDQLKKNSKNGEKKPLPIKVEHIYLTESPIKVIEECLPEW